MTKIENSTSNSGTDADILNDKYMPHSVPTAHTHTADKAQSVNCYFPELFTIV